ncbi:MAG: radical SAM protein [Candidatus Heimdallarchaeota archaeon]|nr:MAG: radical SAM protein [Candidatus Heimdallarchaeota archaeon]
MRVIVDKSLCKNCNYCKVAIACSGEETCIACGSCVDACPYSARKLIENGREAINVGCTINGQYIDVQSHQSVLQVLESFGYQITSFPEKDSIFAPCRTGGCYSCAVQIDGELRPSCNTPIREGMVINTQVETQIPKRIVSGFQGHHVGGVGTPKNLSSRSPLGYLEVACFASGCLYRCSTCQNWRVTYMSHMKPLNPNEAASRLTIERKHCQVDRMAISGGESTLNRKWLIKFVEYLKKLNPDSDARIHIDTNAAILTTDYIDELVEAGMTDIGPDLKGLQLKTFMNIICQKSPPLAKKYLKTSWDAVKYILDEYYDRVFMGVGIPFNRTFMSLDEISEIGFKLAKWDPTLQVTVLDYRPEFRAQTLHRPTYDEMLQVKTTLENSGLKKVMCQTSGGYIR